FSFPINLIVVSDHGMEEIDPNKLESFGDSTDFQGVRVIGEGSQVFIYEKDPQKLQKIEQDLRKKARHFRVYRPEEYPKHWKFSGNARTGDLMLVADPFYQLVKNKTESYLLKLKGNHGEDPRDNHHMQGILYAQGPQIRQRFHL